MSHMEVQKTDVSIGRWKSYPANKDSKIHWLGEVPCNWPIARMRFYININPAKSEIKGISSDTLVSFVPMESVGVYGGLCLDQSISIEEVGSGYTYFSEGDVLVAKITPCFENGKAAIAERLKNRIGFGSTELHVLRPKNSVDRKFLFYLAMSHAFRKQGASYMYGAGGQKRVPDEFIRNFRHPIPSIDEQQAITAFLDRETSRIDTLIAKKQRQIELLQEKRTALISHAVTKGLNPDAKMKDSGIEWLGEIPEHWGVFKIKHVASLHSGHTPSRQHPEYWEDCTIPWFSLADVWQIRDGIREYLDETKEKISTLGIQKSSAELLPAGTVVVSRTASVGFSGIMSVPMATTQDFANWVCGQKIMPEYLLYVFRSMGEEFKRLIMGSTHKTIYMPDVATFVTPLPPLHEQNLIVQYVQKKKQDIERLKSAVSLSIAKLEEYRTALISAAVTGKIDVRKDVA